VVDGIAVGPRREAAATWQWHSTFYLALGEAAEPALWGGPGQRPWLARLELERDNLRAALAWAGDHAPEAAARIGATLWRLWAGQDFTDAEAVAELRRGLALLDRIPGDAERLQTELGLRMPSVSP